MHEHQRFKAIFIFHESKEEEVNSTVMKFTDKANLGEVEQKSGHK